MKSFIKFALVFLGVAILSGGLLALDFFKRNDLVLPRTVIGNISLSGMTRGEAREAVRTLVEKFSQQSFELNAVWGTVQINLHDLGIAINESAIMDKVPFASGFSNMEIIVMGIAGQRIFPTAYISESTVLRVIAEKFPDIPKAKNASIIIKGGHRQISPESIGLAPNLDPLRSQLREQISFLEYRPLTVKFEDSMPDIAVKDLEEYKAQISAAFPKKITLTYEKKKWEVDFENHPDEIIFARKRNNSAPGILPFSLEWDPVKFSTLVDDKISKALEQAPDNVRIFRDSEGKIQFEGRPNEGRAIDRESLLTYANTAIEEGMGNIEIPLVVVPPKVEIEQGLQDMGIAEIISIGHTRFVGSPPNRMHNIGVGVAKFNGVIIPKEETFSFGDELGPVDGSTGYKKELVIKPEGTIPEFGGGLCQVSSTMYRAAIYGGLPITERRAHKYAVTYYSQIGGHGLDATVYPPSQDLKFTNDTPGAILIQSYVAGADAYFVFYGTKDGREVVLDGPYTSKWKAAPKEPLLVPDKKLAAGERKQVEKPHDGFDTLWFRRITKNGATVEEKIASHYEAMAAKFLVGGEVVPDGAAKTPAANPFE